MKKFIFIAAALLAGVCAANAQEYKPDAMSFSTELNYNPGGQTGRFSLPEYGIKGRLFLTDRFAVKLNLGFTVDSEKTITYTEETDNSVTKSEATTSSTTFSLMPGVEYHFGDFKRVSPYVGASIGFNAGRTRETDPNELVRKPTFGFGINLETGVDVYICEGLYAGAELGLGYGLTKTGRGVTISNNGGTEVQTKGSSEKLNNSFGFFATPSIRIGWFF